MVELTESQLYDLYRNRGANSSDVDKKFKELEDKLEVLEKLLKTHTHKFKDTGDLLKAIVYWKE
jgi:predicted nuclease with TOPRIM domain